MIASGTNLFCQRWDYLESSRIALFGKNFFLLLRFDTVPVDALEYWDKIR
jgi:hypothetical protein